jgi:hypothetical protein
VSTCIALATECFKEDRPAKLVLVMDKMVTLGGTTSLETGMKGQQLGERWHCVFAGNDVSHADAVIDLTDSLMVENEEESATKVRDRFTHAYHTIRKKQIEDQLLSSFNWTIEDFLKIGRKQLPISHFSSLLTDIQNFDLGCQFILSGFPNDDAEEPNIYVIENPGVAHPHDIVGFASIGAGETNASAYLTWREHSRHDDLWETVYNGIAAKALSEKAIGVGFQTDVVIIPAKGEYCFLDIKALSEIRDIWESEEHFHRPKNLKKRVQKLVKEGMK